MAPPQPRRSAGNQLDETSSASDIRKRRSLGSHGDKSPASNSGESSKSFRHKRLTHTTRAGPGQSPMSERQQMALLMQMTSTPDAELSPNSQSSYKPRERNERGETPLHIAAKKGDLEGAKKLLEQGSNPNVTDFAGWTPLHEAANHGHYHLAQLLLKHGANVMATGFDDVTPLHDAAMYGNQRLVELLIEKGADPLFKNKKGKAPYEVSHHSLVSFFNDLVDEMANKQQQKKPSTTATSSGNSSGSGDLKKTSGEVGEESNTMASSSSAPSDVYEFVSTPKHSSCSSGDENPIGKSFDKSSDDKSGTDSDTPSISASAAQPAAASAASSSNVTANMQQKRALGDQLDRNDDNLSPADEDSKRKKRKESEFMSKDSGGGGGGAGGGGSKGNSGTSSSSQGATNRVTSRVGNKIPGPASKTMNLMNKAGTQFDRKSESPKMTATAKSPAEAEAEGDDLKGGGGAEGPKVPPLKIVIPQQSGSSEAAQEGGAQNVSQRTNKTVATRNVGSGLPYVINSSSNQGEGGSEKDAAAMQSTLATSSSSTATTTAGSSVVLGSLLRSQSPSADSGKSNDEGKSTSTTGKSKEPRILRSSQRSGKDSKDDRSSNNSSPQLPASSTPSPAAQNTDSSAGTESDHPQTAAAATATATASSQLSQPSTSQASATSTSSAGSAAPQSQTSTTASSASLQSQQAASNQPSSSSSAQSSSQQQSGSSSSNAASTSSGGGGSAAAGAGAASSSSQSSVELHPRKRKIKASSKEPQNSSSSSSSSASSTADLKDTNSKDGQEKSTEPVHPHDQPFTNCYQMYIDLRKQIEQRHNNLHPIEPRPLKGLEDYLMNRRTYSLQGKTPIEPPNIIIPPLLPIPMKETFVEQEKERHRLKMKHIVEKEKLVLSKEQEILRVHCKAAQMQANQQQPFSVCTILKDVEVYNPVTPEHEERYNNRSFFKELKDLDDKWDKIKEAMIIRHTNESESLHAVQKMDWGWKLKELALCDYKATPEIEELHVPMVDVSDEYTTPSIKS